MLTEAEASYRLGADRQERSDERTNSRNGYRRRKIPLKTPLGPTAIRIPKLRLGSFFGHFGAVFTREHGFDQYHLRSAHYADVSTCKMSQLFEDFGLANIS